MKESPLVTSRRIAISMEKHRVTEEALGDAKRKLKKSIAILSFFSGFLILSIFAFVYAESFFGVSVNPVRFGGGASSGGGFFLVFALIGFIFSAFDTRQSICGYRTSLKNTAEQGAAANP